MQLTSPKISQFRGFTVLIFLFSGICAKDDECKNQDIPTISKPNLEKFFFDLENTIRDLMMPQQTRNSLQEEKLIEDI